MVRQSAVEDFVDVLVLQVNTPPQCIYIRGFFIIFNQLCVMITLSIMPNFKGTLKETLAALGMCLLLDSTYLVPIVNHYI